MSDGMDSAIGMLGTGIGLGIMTMGAMIPLVVMKNMVENGPVKVKGKQSMKINLPKINIDLKANLPKATVRKIKLK
jgi:hypothetical protein